MPGLKPAAIIRAGFEYQDLIGIQGLIDFYRNRNKYLWMQLESEDAKMGYLDDVVAALSDGTFNLTQVKFTADPAQYFLDWAWLFEKRPSGTSLLGKWSASVNGFSLGKINIACLQTNRVPDAEFAETLGSDGRIDFDKIEAARRAAVEKEIGSAFLARKFFKKFQFIHSQPMLADLEADLRSSIVPTDTDIVGWMELATQAKRWAMNKNQPAPDGRITHTHLTQIITRTGPRPIPQSFAVPKGYEVPSAQFHNEFLKRVSTGQNITVLWGTPGRGKSTYLSYLTGVLRKKGVAVIRHHYFLSLDDTTADRFSFTDIAQSLLDQILVHYPDAVKNKGLHEAADQLPKWLEACGKHFAANKVPFIVVIDGLDHVWRERRNLDQLNHLFENLLPAAENVSIIVGTQKVANDKLPTRLLKKISKKDWREIPPMDEYSVQSWVKQHHKAKRLRLPKPHYNETVAGLLGEIGTAFFKISKGHPLHLIYSFEALVKDGGFVDKESIELLPVCPSGDINNYYALLWAKLPVQARQIMHVIAGSDFHWPLEGIVRNFGQLDAVDFLLEHRRIGLVPFHGSILAFVREMPDHSPIFKSLLPRVIKWLKKDAPAYWKWGWLWLMQAKAGDSKALLRETTREWAVNSIRDGWGLRQLESILREAETIAFGRYDYARTIELRSLKTRILNAEEYQTSDFEQLVECSVVTSSNQQMVEVMADGLTTLDEKRILTLCRAAAKLDPEVCMEARGELGRRVNLWLDLRHRSGEEFTKLTKYYLEAASLCDDVRAAKNVGFIEGFTDGDPIYELYLEVLGRAGRVDALVESYAALKGKAAVAWKASTLDCLMRTASATSVSAIAEIRKLAPTKVSGFAASWLYYKKAKIAISAKAPIRPAVLSDKNPEYRRNYTAEKYLYDVFFYELSVGLRKPRAAKAAYPISPDFIDRAINMVVRCARDIASGNSQLSFATIYYAASSIEPVDHRDVHNPESSQYFGLKFAMRRIAVDLHLLKQPVGSFAALTDDELATGRASKHWVEELWLEEQLDRNLAIMSAAQAAASLGNEVAYLNSHVTPFNERGDKWVILSRFAMLYGLRELPELVRRAADCAIAHGWRKDLWVLDILDSVAMVHEAGAANGLPLLRTLVPIVDQITEFTDGDETDHVRSQIIETVATVSPQRLSNYYSRHVEDDEFRYAEQALEQLVKIADVNSPITHALAHTFLEDFDISTLKELGKASPKAQMLFDDQTRYVGGSPPKERELANSPSPKTKFKKPPKVEKYGPNDFEKLAKKIHGPRFAYDAEELVLGKWLDYWTAQGQGKAALKSMRKYLEEDNRTLGLEPLLDHVFQVSKQVEGKKAAFYWLVQAHIHRHGWQRYWTSEKDVMARLSIAASLYKAKWNEFIQDTSVQAAYWRRRNYSFAIGHKYLVRFLLMVDQKSLAVDVTRAMVKTIVEEVSDQPLPDCPWFN